MATPEDPKRDNGTNKEREKHDGIAICSSTDFDDDDESVMCRWRDVSEDSVWEIMGDDSDEQEISHVDGGDSEPHDITAEFVIPLGHDTSLVWPSEGSRTGMFYRGANGDNRLKECEQRGRLMAMTFQVAKVTRPLASLLRKSNHI